MKLKIIDIVIALMLTLGLAVYIESQIDQYNERILINEVSRNK